jgi:hypothetical protein
LDAGAAGCVMITRPFSGRVGLDRPLLLAPHAQAVPSGFAGSEWLMFRADRLRVPCCRVREDARAGEREDARRCLHGDRSPMDGNVAGAADRNELPEEKRAQSASD